MALFRRLSLRSARGFSVLATLACAVMMLTGEAARAQVVFDPAISYTQSKVTDNAGAVGNSDVKDLTADLKLGYLLTAQGIIVGGMYKVVNTSLAGGDVKGYAIGPMVGWTTGGFLIAATYYLMGENKVTAGGTETKYSSLTGLQVDAAYTHMFTPQFGLGPQLTYRNAKFGKSTVGSAAETSNSLEVAEVYPAIALHFAF